MFNPALAATCQDCPLAQTRTQVVLPSGPLDAEIVVVGEAPGADEDKEGRPFVGRSGKKLTYLLSCAGIDRDKVLVTNTVMCRPPANRPPRAKEVAACKKHLDAVMGAHPRRAILAVGDKAVKAVVGKGHEAPLKAYHGRVIAGTVPPVVALYHPAAAMHNPNLIPVLIKDYENIRTELIRNLIVNAPHKAIATTADFHYLHPELPPTIAFDLETTWIKDRVGDVSVVGYSVALPNIDHAYFVRDNPCDLLFNRTVVAHNAQFEYQVMKARGITLTQLWDTKLAAYILGYPVTELKALVLQKYGYEMKRLEDLTNGFKIPVEDIAPNDLAQYGADDAFWTLRLAEDLGQELTVAGLTKLYNDIELPLISVLGDVMLRGIEIDRSALTTANEALTILATKMETWLRAALGKPDINLNSGDQLAAVLFNKHPEGFGFPIIKLTESRNRPSTDRQVLEVLAQRHPIANDILEYRHIEKLRSTYAEGILDRTSAERPRLYAHFNQAGGFEDRDTNNVEAPSTGRLSSSGPNLTNIPKHDAPGLTSTAPLIRRCFIARPGCSLVVGDLSQEEFRIAAYLSQDPAMLTIINDGLDWHTSTARVAFGHHDVTAEERYYGKQGNFSKLNGASPARIARAAKCTLTIGRKISDAFDLLHPRYQTWRDEVAASIAATGYAYTWYGRRRFLPGIWSRDPATYAEAVRQGVNVPIQGTAADILKICLVRLDTALSGHDAGIVSIVHDEVVVETLDTEIPYVVQCLKEMTTGLLDTMLLPVEVEVGKNWSKASLDNPLGLKGVQ